LIWEWGGFVMGCFLCWLGGKWFFFFGTWLFYLGAFVLGGGGCCVGWGATKAHQRSWPDRSKKNWKKGRKEKGKTSRHAGFRMGSRRRKAVFPIPGKKKTKGSMFVCAEEKKKPARHLGPRQRKEGKRRRGKKPRT